MTAQRAVQHWQASRDAWLLLPTQTHVCGAAGWCLTAPQHSGGLPHLTGTYLWRSWVILTLTLMKAAPMRPPMTPMPMKMGTSQT